MYSKLSKGIAFIIGSICYIQPSLATNSDTIVLTESKPVNLAAQPEQCVAIRQGRQCFATINLHWQSLSIEPLCLYQLGGKTAIECWRDTSNAQISIEFESSESLVYQLKTLSNNQVVAETKITVSWQHKRSSTKRRWRLF